jgi:calpain-15
MVVDPSRGIFDPQVFEKEIDPSDILQGQLGDCWFLCAVSCLAEMPQLVERLILTKEVSEEGIYRVRICKNGEWQEVVVDDYFPCYPNGEPMFSRAHGNELWVLLLEKAYAKLHGSYKNIVGGLPHEAMMDLTGCPTTTFSFKEDNV